MTKETIETFISFLRSQILKNSKDQTMQKLRSILQAEFSTIGEEEFVRLFAARRREWREGNVPLRENAAKKTSGEPRVGTV